MRRGCCCCRCSAWFRRKSAKYSVKSSTLLPRMGTIIEREPIQRAGGTPNWSREELKEKMQSSSECHFSEFTMEDSSELPDSITLLSSLHCLVRTRTRATTRKVTRSPLAVVTTRRQRAAKKVYGKGIHSQGIREGKETFW